MGYHLSPDRFEALFRELSKTYAIYAPIRFHEQGRYRDVDRIAYAEVTRPSDIVWKEKSDNSAKEVITPLNETIFYLTEDEYREPKEPTRDFLVFVHPCDIVAQTVQDDIFLRNGNIEDFYYKRARERLHYVMMECGGGDEDCFCVSMQSNKTDDYDLAMRFSDDGSADFIVKNEDFRPYFEGAEEVDYNFTFVEENELKVEVPDFGSQEARLRLKRHPMWQEYNKRCISCGACTACCPTCTCFQTRDNIWNYNPMVGDRRRVHHSCQVPGYDQMAGQREMRSTPADRMRYKMMHKFRDHKARFASRNMCVGCGRCTKRCPELISITATLKKMAAASREIQEELAREEKEGSRV